MPSITGTAGPDTLVGTAGDDTLQGLDGDDVLSDSLGGSDFLIGGNGADQLTILRTTGGVTDTVTLSGLDGNDTIIVQGPPSIFLMQTRVFGGDGADQISISNAGGFIDAGAGDDTVTLFGTDQLSVTLGPGSDTLRYELAGNILGPQLVTDFQTGDAGDVLVIDGLASMLVGWDGSNPFNHGYLRLQQQGTTTALQFSVNGVDMYRDLVDFANTTASQFTAKNLSGFAAPGAPPPGSSTTSITVTAPTVVPAGAIVNFSASNGAGSYRGYILDGSDSNPASALLSIAGAVKVDAASAGPAWGVWADTGDAQQLVVIQASGSLTVTSGGGAGAISRGYYADSFAGVAFENFGTMTVTSGVSAVGIETYDLHSPVTNAGTLHVTSPGRAIGMIVHNSNALITNSGVIEVHGGGDESWGVAVANFDSAFANTATGVIVVTDTTPGLDPNTASYKNSNGLYIDSAGGSYFNAGLISADIAVRIDEKTPGSEVPHFFENAPHGILQGEFVGSGGRDELDNGGLIQGDVLLGFDNDVYDGSSGGTVVGLVSGNEGDDLLLGGPVADSLQGNQGNDTAHGNGGDDIVVGGKDDDMLFGDAGSDIVWGNLGNDTLDGGDGNDQVRGGQGDDVVNGGAGDDFVSGDRGNDTITGGAGADIFHGSQDAGIDKVMDFHLAEGDRVMLDPGTHYTISQVGADTIIDMGASANGAPNQTILVGVTLSSLKDGWIFLG